MKTYFVSGIDTGIGKTVATGLMARYLRSRGVDAITVKMVQTGCVGFSEDIDEHRRICGGAKFEEDALGLTAPQIFAFPGSARLAARLEGRVVDTAKIVSAVEACGKAHDVVLVESAGGLCVPLAENLLSVDFAAAQGWPLVLVTCGRLGSLNHTLLSLEAARARGMAVAGVVYNWSPGVDPKIDEDTPATIAEYLKAWNMPAEIVRIPEMPPSGPCPDVDFSEIFK